MISRAFGLSRRRQIGRDTPPSLSTHGRLFRLRGLSPEPHDGDLGLEAQSELLSRFNVSLPRGVIVVRATTSR